MKKIRLLIVYYKLTCGGVDRALLDLIRMLDRDRFEITLFVTDPSGEWEEKFRQTGVRILHKKRKAAGGLVSRLALFVRSRFLRVFRPQHDDNLLENELHETFDLAISYKYSQNEKLADSCRKLAPKTIGYIHGDIATNHELEFTQTHWNALNKWDSVICVSRAAWNSMCRNPHFKGGADRCRLVYNPVYYPEIAQRAAEPLPIDVGGPYICAVGRLSPEKGMVRLLYIFQRLVDAGVQEKLVIVGDGPDRRTMEYILRGLRCRDRVILAGYRENPYPFIRGSVLTVLPSYTEGLPVVGAESMCLGVPLVAAYPSVAECFGEEACGLITENDDDSLYKGLYRMLTDAQAYRAAKEAAARRSEFYKSDALIREAERAYLETIEG